MNAFDVLRTYKIRAKKRFGQNFLIDQNILDKIMASLNLSADDIVLEIGAGFGVLTDRLVRQCGYVYAVEIDCALADVLRAEFAGQENIEIINNDILKVAFSDLCTTAAKIKVVGNIPYNITSKIIFALLEQRTYIRSIVLTIQKEVADRLLAVPGSKAYGRMTVAVRYFATVEKLFDVKKNCFKPVPEVDSTVIRITIADKTALPGREALFLDVVEALFAQRRKRILNSLCLMKTKKITRQDARVILDGCNIDSQKRAEALMMKEFVAIAQAVDKY